MAQQQPSVADILNQFKDVILVLIGALLGFLSSWIVSKRERKWGRADQRREKIYGPLQDELAIIGLALPKNEDILKDCAEYQRIKSEHVRYLIPRKLRSKVIELYERVIPRYAEEKKALGRKYNNKMRTQITYGLIPQGGPPTAVVTATSRAEVTTMASLSYWLVEDKTPPTLEREMQTAFQVVKEDSRKFTYATWQAFFEAWRKILEHDDDFKKFVETRDKAITLTQEITGEIAKDLESEN